MIGCHTTGSLVPKIRASSLQVIGWMNKEAERGGHRRKEWGPSGTRHSGTILTHSKLKAILRHKCESLHFSNDKTEAMREYSANCCFAGGSMAGR